MAWNWSSDADRLLIVVNLSDAAAQAQVKVPWTDLKGRQWCLTDLLSGTAYERHGDEMLSLGLYVDLQPWNYHFLRVSQRLS